MRADREWSDEASYHENMTLHADLVCFSERKCYGDNGHWSHSGGSKAGHPAGAKWN